MEYSPDQQHEYATAQFSAAQDDAASATSSIQEDSSSPEQKVSTPTLIAAGGTDELFECVDKRIRTVHESFSSSILPLLCPKMRDAVQNLAGVAESRLIDTICQIDNEELSVILRRDSLMKEGISSTFEKLLLNTCNDNGERLMQSLDNIAVCILGAAADLQLLEKDQDFFSMTAFKRAVGLAVDTALREKDNEWLDGLAAKFADNEENREILKAMFKKRAIENARQIDFFVDRSEKFRSSFEEARSKSLSDFCAFCGAYRAMAGLLPDSEEQSASSALPSPSAGVCNTASPDQILPRRDQAGGSATHETDHDTTSEGRLLLGDQHGDNETRSALVEELDRAEPREEPQGDIDTLIASNKTQEKEIEDLKEEVEALREQLRASEKRCQQLEGQIRASASEERCQSLEDAIGRHPDQWNISEPMYSTTLPDMEYVDGSETSSQDTVTPAAGRTLADELEDVQSEDNVSVPGRSGVWLSNELSHWTHVFDFGKTQIMEGMRMIGLIKIDSDYGQDSRNYSKQLCVFSLFVVILHCQLIFNFIVAFSLMKERNRWLQGNGLTRMYLIEYMHDDPSSVFLPGVDLRFIWDTEMMDHARRTLPQVSMYTIGLLPYMWRSWRRYASWVYKSTGKLGTLMMRVWTESVARNTDTCGASEQAMR